MMKYLRGEVGVTLVSVMIIIVLTTILGAGLLTSATMEYKIVHRLEDRKQAYYLAQAGIEYARYRLQKDLTWRVEESEPQYLGNGYFVLSIVDNGDNQLLLRSTGWVADVSKTLEVDLLYTTAGGTELVEELAGYLIISGGATMQFSNHIILDGDIRSNGDIEFYNRKTIPGDVLIIASGRVIEHHHNPPLVQEQIIQNADEYLIPEVDWDQLRDLALAEGRYMTQWDQGQFRDGVVNYIEGDVNLNPAVDLSLQGILVINGALRANNSFRINQGRPNNRLMIFVDGSVTMNNRAEINAAIFATDRIECYNHTEIDGALYSRKTVRCTNFANISLESGHLLQSIVEEFFISTGSGDASDQSMSLSGWREI